MQNFLSFKPWYLSLLVFLAIASASNQTLAEITFTGGQPLHQYQPSIIVPILTEAFKRNGIKFKALHHPSLRSLLYSSTGFLDGELHRIYDFHKVSGGQYPDLIRIESKMLTVWLAVFATKKIKFETWADLKGHTVAYSRGRKNLEKTLPQYLPADKIIAANNDTHAFKMLSEGSVDLVISESRLGDDLLEAYSLFSNITKINKIYPTRIYSYMHKKHQQLAADIALTIEQMKEDGSYAKIVETVNITFK
ncbi:MAG: transporter substrate-binding domain-containing protein [Pseudomonadales bacterium]|nr:transporter substrate-binding domain-containing protein [Pseudomonadales bacterium]NRA16754.1 transporter substrate-binding domain-containing protein [Oceanospirillaceae bacterium]